jgi:hypothetical protein
MKALIWTILQSRLGLHRGRALFTGYTMNTGWYYQDIYKRWEAGDPDYDVIQFPSTANPDYPREEFERARQTLPDWLFDMRYLGQFRKPAGLVYACLDSGAIVDPFPVPGGWPIYVGLDPGVYFAALFLTWQSGVYYAFGEYYTEMLKSAADHGAGMRAVLPASPLFWIYDPSRATDMANLAPEGVLPQALADNAVLAGIVTVITLLKAGRLKFMRGRCPVTLDQLGKYSFPTEPATGAVARENPIKKDDHLPDCLRYVLHTLEGPRIDQEMVTTETQPGKLISRY